MGDIVIAKRDLYICQDERCDKEGRSVFTDRHSVAAHELRFHDGAQTCWTLDEIEAALP